MSQTDATEPVWESPGPRIRWMVWVACLAGMTLLSLCVAPTLLGIGIELLKYLGFGWTSVLQREELWREFRWPNLLLGIIACGLLIWAAPHAAQRLFPAHAWKGHHLRRGTVMGFLAIFAGISLVGVLHELQWWARQPGQMARFSRGGGFQAYTDRRNDLKNIGIALGNYDHVQHRLPLGGEFDQNGNAGHGWTTALLPYIDQTPLYQSIRRDLPWNHAANRQPFETRVPAYESHLVWLKVGVPDGGYAQAHYAANRLILRDNFSLRLDQITDALSSTMLAGEIAEQFPAWGSPANYRDLRHGINQGPHTFGSVERGRYAFIMIVLADGSVRSINVKTEASVLKALASPKGADYTGDY